MKAQIRGYERFGRPLFRAFTGQSVYRGHIYSRTILSLTPRFNEGSEAFRTPLETVSTVYWSPASCRRQTVETVCTLRVASGSQLKLGVNENASPKQKNSVVRPSDLIDK